MKMSRSTVHPSIKQSTNLQEDENHPSTKYKQQFNNEEVSESPIETVDDNFEHALTQIDVTSSKWKTSMAAFRVIKGYSQVGAAPIPVIAPKIEKKEKPKPNDRACPNIPIVTKSIAREALLEIVSQHFCYGTSAVKNLVYIDLKSTPAYHYTMESFTESRETSWTYENFQGQPIDGPDDGDAPEPWMIEVPTPKMFREGSTTCEVPHTASIKKCHGCDGLKSGTCSACSGAGKKKCGPCGGLGKRRKTVKGTSKRCDYCHGTTKRLCIQCHGKGKLTCEICSGRGKVKVFIQLKVEWHCYKAEEVVERTDLPDELVKDVKGREVFREEGEVIWPLDNFPDQSIMEASLKLIDSHRDAFPNEKLLAQRHRVRVIPVTEAITEWKKSGFNYFLYGFENKVYAPDYPQKSCCTIQ